MEIYIECEILRTREAPEACHITIAHTAFADTCLHLGVLPDKLSLDKAVDISFMPRLRVDAIEAVRALHKRGYTLLGIPSLDPATFSRYFERHIPPEVTIDIPYSAWTSPHAQNPALLPAILQHSQCRYPNIKPTQILLVTASPYRIIEPACAAGFPAVLLRNDADLEFKVILDTTPPTLIIENLLALRDAMDGPELSNPSVVPAVRPY